MKRNWMIVIFASVLVLGCDPGDGLTEDGYRVESFTYNGTSCKKKCDQLCAPKKDKDKECCKTTCDKPAAPGCKTDCDKKCMDQYPGKKQQDAAKKCCKSACPPPPPGKCGTKCDEKCLKGPSKPGEDLKDKCCKKICETEPPPKKPVCDKQCADYLTKLGFDKKVIEDKCCKKPLPPKCDKNDPKCKPEPKCDKNDPKCKPEPKCDKDDPKCKPKCDPKKDPKCAPPPKKPGDKKC